MKKVTSLSNPDVKRVRSLAQRKYREEEGLFLTEGLRHAIEAMEAGWEFDTLLVEESAGNKDLAKKLIAYAEKQRARILEVPERIMESVTKRDNAQTVVAALRQRWAEMKDVKDGFWVALEEIRDPGNLGTILRTCDAVRAEGAILIGNTCDPYSPEAVRASMGSFPQVKLVRCGREEFVKGLPESFQVVGTHLKTEHDYRGIQYKKPLVILMGNEQAGLTEEMAKACTHLVKIPMLGKADSLNVSVATAIMLYETVRQPC